MSAQISNISLYIPHVFPNYTKEDVTEVFENQKIGKVSHVDFVSKMGQDGKVYNAAYIHFDFWCDTIANRNFQARICDPAKEARIVYDEPWHWIVLENKARKYAVGERKPRIDIGDLQVKPKVVNDWIEIDADFLELIGEMATDEEDTEFKQLINEMDECEADMQEEDQYLTSIDARYIQTLEEENSRYYNEIYQMNIRIMELNNSLYLEQVKSNALAETIRMVSIKN